MSQTCCDTYTDRCLSKIKTSGLRVTEQRKEIIRVLEQATKPFTAKDVADQLAEISGRDIDFATTFRTLQTFSELELVHPVGQTGHFISCNSEHVCKTNTIHVIFSCFNCDHVREHQVDTKLSQSISRATESLSQGFTTSSTVLYQYGLCKNCSG